MSYTAQLSEGYLKHLMQVSIQPVSMTRCKKSARAGCVREINLCLCSRGVMGACFHDDSSMLKKRTAKHNVQKLISQASFPGCCSSFHGWILRRATTPTGISRSEVDVSVVCFSRRGQSSNPIASFANHTCALSCVVLRVRACNVEISCQSRFQDTFLP